MENQKMEKRGRRLIIIGILSVSALLVVVSAILMFGGEKVSDKNRRRDEI